MNENMLVKIVSLFHVMSGGSEEIRLIPGNQTTLDLRDLIVGVSYGVSVTALVGENEGDPVTVYIKPGGWSGDTVLLCASSSFPVNNRYLIYPKGNLRIHIHIQNTDTHRN